MTDITADQALAAWKAEGIIVVEVTGWRTRNRNSHGPAGPKRGVVNHHTGSNIDPRAAYVYADGLLQEGYSSLPGPLCHAGVGPDGVLYPVGWGRTNHAGGGGSNVLAAVIAEQIPTGAPNAGNSNGVDGNGPFYGFEVMYSGGQSMSTAQWQTLVRANAALERLHGWSERSSISHSEWSSDKWDIGAGSPQSWAHSQQLMNALRADIKACLALPPGAWGRGKTPAQQAQETAAAAAAAAEAVKQAQAAVQEAAQLKNLRSIDMRIVQHGNSQFVAWADGTFSPLYTSVQGAAVGKVINIPPTVLNDTEWAEFVKVFVDRRTLTPPTPAV